MIFALAKKSGTYNYICPLFHNGTEQVIYLVRRVLAICINLKRYIIAPTSCISVTCLHSSSYTHIIGKVYNCHAKSFGNMTGGISRAIIYNKDIGLGNLFLNSRYDSLNTFSLIVGWHYNQYLVHTPRLHLTINSIPDIGYNASLQ